MVGNKPKKCDRCGEVVRHGNMKRHIQRHHRGQQPQAEPCSSPESSAPLELSGSLSEVLMSCGVPLECWPTDREQLDRLQNYRLLGNRTTAFDLPGELRPQIVRDRDQDEALPSFEELVIRLAAITGAEKGKNRRLPENCIVRATIMCSAVDEN